MERKIIQTADGSKTVYLSALDETYHSSHGALQEAKHVFIRNGLHYLCQESLVRIFEMGFGTGLNALLALHESLNGPVKIEYTGIEAYPVEAEIWQSMEYASAIDPTFQDMYDRMHTAPWNERIGLTADFAMRKVHSKIEDYAVEGGSQDLIFYDAFGPRAQSEMWTLPMLEKMHRLLRPGGVLVTYCAMGQFKRNLKSLGFLVESLPGPPGKREMTRAVKIGGEL